MWVYPILLAMVALAFDAADRRVPFDLISSGLLDEAAHLATAALGLMALACFIDTARRFYVAALIASVAIDLDHIPLYLGLLPDPNQRPPTHSLATVAVFAIAAAASRRHRAVLAGVAVGLVLHFVRDIAEGPPGVRMLWPLQQTAWAVGARWFLGMIIALTVLRLVLVSTGLPRRRIRYFQPAEAKRGPVWPTGRNGPVSGGPGNAAWAGMRRRAQPGADAASTDRIRMSPPDRTAASGLPHGHSGIGPSGSNSWPQEPHRHRAATSLISSRAPSRLVPSVAGPK